MTDTINRKVEYRDNRIDANFTYVAPESRVTHYAYNRVGDTGLIVSPIGLGFWYNFGDDKPFQNQRDIVRHAFDNGVNHFDLANNYGPPLGAAEENFGRILKKDFSRYRHEMVITTKAGWPQWLGANGRLNGRKHLFASLDESLTRLGTDHVDIFYSHRYDPDTPLEETIGALKEIVQRGKALYVGISSYSAQRTREALAVAKATNTPLIVNQVAYSMINRWAEDELITDLGNAGASLVAFTPLAQGLLADRYLEGFDKVDRGDVRARYFEGGFSEENLERLRGLAAIARERGQTLSQLALAWALRDHRVASVLIGVSKVEQLAENLGALQNTAFTDEELARIDKFAVHDGGVNPWRLSSEL